MILPIVELRKRVFAGDRCFRSCHNIAWRSLPRRSRHGPRHETLMRRGAYGHGALILGFQLTNSFAQEVEVNQIAHRFALQCVNRAAAFPFVSWSRFRTRDQPYDSRRSPTRT